MLKSIATSQVVVIEKKPDLSTLIDINLHSVIVIIYLMIEIERYIK